MTPPEISHLTISYVFSSYCKALHYILREVQKKITFLPLYSICFLSTYSVLNNYPTNVTNDSFSSTFHATHILLQDHLCADTPFDSKSRFWFLVFKEPGKFPPLLPHGTTSPSTAHGLQPQSWCPCKLRS